ncbi:MAG TPA: CDGSH iron-sulfur domain-containing protein [Cycloclasticus sp.]|nr:CDGSH iron-sulfur domain-containing protein [Cycloclasticus sp.]HIL92698.1 CDGSH iron-sulfur domain-containing protein [Cycloclasticus sp.]
MYSQQFPYSVAIKKDEEIYICQCGKTAKSPLCDGSHKQTDGVRPLIFTAEKDQSLTLCGCGKSADIPWCDGSHNR